MMNRKKIDQIRPLIFVSVLSTSLCASIAAFAQTAPPPSLGQDTKGQPAIEEAVEPKAQEPAADSALPDSNAIGEKSEKNSGGPLGTATIKESRRENGQVYLIELEHSAGAKQYIEENDSDGNIELKSDDLDETPNLPKWKIGSW